MLKTPLVLSSLAGEPLIKRNGLQTGKIVHAPCGNDLVSQAKAWKIQQCIEQRGKEWKVFFSGRSVEEGKDREKWTIHAVCSN